VIQGMKPAWVADQLGKMRPNRANAEWIWQQVADYIMPLKNDVIQISSPGTQKYNNILDNTGIMANEELASTLHTFLSNPSGYFFGLSSGDPMIDMKDAVRSWIQTEVRAMHDTLNNSNFQTEIHELYQSLVGNGFSGMLMEEDEETVVRFSTRPIRELFVAENSKGVIDRVWRPYKLTAQGIVDEFATIKGVVSQATLKTWPRNVQDAYNKGASEEFEIIHALYPAKMVKEGKTVFNVISHYVLAKDKSDLLIEGFYELPGVFPRWSKIPGEPYGRGCGEKALPEVKMLQLMADITIRGAQKTIDPPLQMPDNGFVMPLLTRPASINYYRAGSQDRVTPIFNDARIDFGIQLIQQSQLKVRQAYFVDQLSLPTNGPQMTATESQTRTDQSMRILSPMLGRLQSELLDPIITRLYSIRQRRGLVAPVPQEIHKVKLTTLYTSVIAMAQRQSELSNIRRTMTEIGPFVSADPAGLQNFNTDRSIMYIAKLCNLPQEMLKTEKELADQRQQVAQQQQAAQQSAQDAQGADSTSKMLTGAAKLAPPAGQPSL
jgi:hypothetical protein